MNAELESAGFHDTVSIDLGQALPSGGKEWIHFDHGEGGPARAEEANGKLAKAADKFQSPFVFSR